MNTSNNNSNNLLDYINVSIYNKDREKDIIQSNYELEEERYPYKNRIKEVNLLLQMNGFPEVGDLFDSSLFSVNRTLNTLQVLIEDRQKMLDSRSELLQKISKVENEHVNFIERYENSKEKVNELTKQINFLKNKFSVDEKKFSTETDRLKGEKEELNKTVNRLTLKDNQFRHEIKKLEKEVEDNKIRIKKLMNEKIGTQEKLNNNNNGNDNIPTLKQTNNNSNLSNISYSNYNYNSLNHSSLNQNLNTSNLIENLVKNSNNILHNITHLKEFYNLIFQAFDEKMKYILNENEELRDCYKLILKELNQYIDCKKLILTKFSKDILNEQDLTNHNQMINFSIFELDFNDSRDLILNNFNEVINTFRFLLIYDSLRIDPLQEFQFEDIKRTIANKKFDMESIPYYQEVKKTMEGFDFKKLEKLKTLLMKNSKDINNNNASMTASVRKKSIMKDDIFVADSTTERNLNASDMNQTQNLNSNKPLENLEDIHKELMEAMNIFDQKVVTIESELDKVKKGNLNKSNTNTSMQNI